MLEEARAKMIKLAAELGLKDPRVIAQSELLDELILRAQEEKGK